MSRALSSVRAVFPGQGHVQRRLQTMSRGWAKRNKKAKRILHGSYLTQIYLENSHKYRTLCIRRRLENLHLKNHSVTFQRKNMNNSGIAMPTESSIPPLPHSPFFPLTITNPVVITIRQAAKISENTVQFFRRVVMQTVETSRIGAFFTDSYCAAPVRYLRSAKSLLEPTFIVFSEGK